MIPLLYQTSSQKRVIGQIISTDGNTITSSGTAIANTDINLWKFNSTALVDKSTGGATYLSDGVWSITFSSDDTDTLGAMIAFTHVSSALVTKDIFHVMAANTYNSLISTSDYLDVNVISMSSNTISSATISSGAISSLAFSAGAISTAALSSGAISTLTISTAAWDQAANSIWNAARSGFVSTLTMGYTQSTLNWTNISNEVWANSTRTLSSGAAIWAAATRTLTDLSSVALSTAGLDAIWTASTRSLTSLSSFALSTLSQDAISDAVWANSTRRLSTTQSFDLTGGIVGNITGNLSGSVNSVSSAVALLTDRSSFALSTTAIDNIFGAYVESTETVKDSLKLIRATNVGLSSGGASTQVKFYDATGVVTRITADVSTDGNRTVITTDLT